MKKTILGLSKDSIISEDTKLKVILQKHSWNVIVLKKLKKR